MYEYEIYSTGHICGGFPQGDTTATLSGGECDDVYAVMDGTAGTSCDFDTLTIIAWDQATGTVYDTCVQLVHLIETI